MMDSKNKYEAPSSSVVELKYEGILCESLPGGSSQGIINVLFGEETI